MVEEKPTSSRAWSSFFWVGIPTAALILIISIFLWDKLRENERQDVENKLTAASALIVTPIYNIIENHIQSLAAMGKRWELTQGTSEALWTADAEQYYTGTKIYSALEWIDQNMVVQWVVPAQLEPKIKGIDFSKMPSRYEALTFARKTNQPTLSKILEFLQGPKGFFIIIPLSHAKGFEGYIVGAVDVKKLFGKIFNSNMGDDFGIAIYQDSDPVFSTNTKVLDLYTVKKTALKIQNITWHLYIWPTKKLLDQSFTLLPLVVLVSGIIFSMLLLIIFFILDKLHGYSRKMNSARLEAEKALLRLQRILDTVNEGYVAMDKETRLLDWNPCAEKLFGWKKQEVLGAKLFDLIIAPENRDSQFQKITEFVANKQSIVMNKAVELMGRNRSQTLIPIELIIFAIVLDGEITYHLFIRDIAERKQAEEQEARFASIVDASDDAIISVDLNGQVMTWNRGAEKIFGYEKEEIEGKSINTIYTEEDKTELFSLLDKIKLGEHIHNHDAKRLNKDGRIIPVSVLISPMKDKQGKVIGGSSITRDISERKNIEKMKNEFISIVSHELRTPLTSIRGSISILASGTFCALSEKAKQLLEIANTNCERLIRLINDILDIEKIEAGKMDFNLKLIHLNQLLKEAIESNQSLAAKYNIKLELINDEDIEVRAEYDRIMQVVTNLLSNAIRYSPVNGVVKIQITNLLNKVRVSVIDNGPGIGDAFKDKIFGKFTQADSSDTRQKSGTGLGLNISKAIIEKHGGQIGFLSTEGAGSTFYFELHLEKTKTNTMAPTHATPLRLLICDQNVESANSLKDLIQKKNVHVDIASNVQQAKKLISEHHYIAITLDPLLTDEAGASFIQYLRENPNTQETPIIVISGEAEEEKKWRGINYPIVDWMQKPKNKEETQVIIDYINKKFTNRSANILSVEDEMDVTRLISIMLQDRASVWNANSIAKAKKLLQDHEFDLVILDLNLPDGYGASILPCINYRTKEPIPVIVFSVDILAKKYSAMVKNTLLKSIATNEQLLSAIETAISVGKTK